MIQKAQLFQLPQIMQVYAKARMFMAQNGNPLQWGMNYPPEDMIRQDILDGKCYVNLKDGMISAVFYFAVEADPTYGVIDGAWLNDAPYGVIHRIAVAENGKGAAGECFRFAMERCENLRIDTHEDNLPMQRCLLKHGFVRCGIIYLEDGDPRIAYQRSTPWSEN